MAKITRVTQKIFAGDLVANEIGVFGSFKNGSPTYTTSAATVQSLANWTAGWPDAVIGGSNPAIEDVNAVDYVTTYQLAYILQTCAAEWDAGTTYYIGSVVNDGTGILYKSLQNTNLNHAVSLTAWWQQISLPTHPGAAGYVLSANTTTGIGWTNSPLAQDFTNTRVGINLTTPQNKLHTNGANATATYMQVTNGVTTGTTSTDGSLFGIDASGNLVINQQESLSILFSTAGAQAGSIDSNKQWVLGGVSTTPSSVHSIYGGVSLENQNDFFMGHNIWIAAGNGRALNRAETTKTGVAIDFAASTSATANVIAFLVTAAGQPATGGTTTTTFGMDGNGKFTFGETGNTQAHQFNGSLAVVYASGNPQLTISRTGTSTGSYSFGASGNILTIRDEGQAANRLTIGTDGKLSILATGLLLPGSGATTFSQYKEGNITVLIKCTTSNPTIVGLSGTGTFVQVGSLVQFTARMTWGSVSVQGTGSLYVELTGAPIVATNNSISRSTGSISASQITFSGNLGVEILNIGGILAAGLIQTTSAGNQADIAGTAQSSSGAINVTGTYRAAQ